MHYRFELNLIMVIISNKCFLVVARAEISVSKNLKKFAVFKVCSLSSLNPRVCKSKKRLVFS